VNCSNCHIKRLIVFVILIFFSQIFAQNPDFSITINVRGGENDYDLTVGFSPNASDGYDSGLDQYAPPQPPSPAFDAALLWENDRYYTQIVNGDSLDLIEHVWDIQLQFPEDNLITLSWDSGCLSVLGTFTMQNAFGGNLVNVDMTTVDVLILDNPDINILELKVTPNEYFPDVPPQGFEFTPNPASGTFIGTVTINGKNAEECDWIAAFDEDGNCAGSAILIINDDLAWINIPIYGDDSTTPDVDEGMNSGENFILKLWDVSTALMLEYPEYFDCWSNQNGAPMPGCGGINEVYNFSFGSVSGTASDGRGNLLDSVSISIGGEEKALTGADGSFSFNIAVGVYNLNASKMGYNDDSEPGVQVIEDETTTIEFTLNAIYSVSLFSNPEVGGVVSGSGNYIENTFVTVTATANEGYTFVNWTEDDLEVSTEPTYTYQITGDRNLVANFMDIVYTGPTADFTYSIDYLVVEFTDASIQGDGEIVSWIWEFGDGNISMEQNPVYSFSGDGMYFVKLIVEDNNGLTSERIEIIIVGSIEIELPVNYSNPFKDNTTIIFEISNSSRVKIDIFNLLGKNVNSLNSTYINEGVKRVVWNGKNYRGILVRSGLYFYRIHTENEIQTGKMIILR